MRGRQQQRSRGCDGAAGKATGPSAGWRRGHKLTEDGKVKRVDEAGEEAEVSSRLEERGGVKERELATRGRAALAM